MNRRLARKVLEGMLDLVQQKSRGGGGRDGLLMPQCPSPQKTDQGMQGWGPSVTSEKSDSRTIETGLWMLFLGGGGATSFAKEKRNRRRVDSERQR